MVDFVDLRNLIIVLFIITVIITSYRCYARYTKKMWWHDDSVALFSTLSFTLYLVSTVYLAQEIPTSFSLTVGTYLLVTGFYVSIWGARISILLTVVRITPWKRQRMILICIVVFFFIMCAMLLAQLFWVCEVTYNGWKKIPGAICVVPHAVPISILVTTIVSDTILVAAPLMIAKGVSSRALRFRLFFIFSMSIVTTITAVAHAIIVMVKQGVEEAMIGGVNSAVAIAVCNMTVVIPAILRALGVGDPFMREDTVSPDSCIGVPAARGTSTVIELGFRTSCVMEITDKGTASSATSRQPDLDVKGDQKHRLTMQTSDVSLGDYKSMAVGSVVEG